jgi:hypothetical protein
MSYLTEVGIHMKTYLIQQTSANSGGAEHLESINPNWNTATIHGFLHRFMSNPDCGIYSIQM